MIVSQKQPEREKDTPFLAPFLVSFSPLCPWKVRGGSGRAPFSLQPDIFRSPKTST